MSESIAARIIDIIQITDAVNAYLACGGTTPVYTKSFPLPDQASFGVELQFDSPGTVAVKVEMEQGNERVDTQAASTSKMAVPEDKLGASVGLVATSIGDKLTHLVNFAPMVSAFGRLKLTGGGSNDAGTKLTKAKLVYVKNP